MPDDARMKDLMFFENISVLFLMFRLFGEFCAFLWGFAKAMPPLPWCQCKAVPPGTELTEINDAPHIYQGFQYNTCHHGMKAQGTDPLQPGSLSCYLHLGAGSTG